jgi:hypothetical protein
MWIRAVLEEHPDDVKMSALDGFVQRRPAGVWRWRLRRAGQRGIGVEQPAQRAEVPARARVEDSRERRIAPPIDFGL